MNTCKSSSSGLMTPDYMELLDFRSEGIAFSDPHEWIDCGCTRQGSPSATKASRCLFEPWSWLT
jgi:hypothetical protein